MQERVHLSSFLTDHGHISLQCACIRNLTKRQNRSSNSSDSDKDSPEKKKAKSQDSRDEAKHPCEDEMLTALSMSEDVSKTLEQIPASKTGQSRELLREC